MQGQQSTQETVILANIIRNKLIVFLMSLWTNNKQ